jgi:F-type H+-transporting ATPase subunit delta
VSNVGDKAFALAKVYAAAMLELGQEADRVGPLAEELHSLAELIGGDADFRAFLASPTVDVATRARTIEKLFRGKYSDVFVDAVQILNRNDRLGLIGQVAHAYHLLHEELGGRVEVEVRTATALSDVLREKLRLKLTQATGKQVDLLEQVDASLIGGLVVQLGDRKFDNSVRRKLAVVGQALLERASRELHSGKSYAVAKTG